MTSLREMKKAFIAGMQGIYDEREAGAVFRILLEHLTGASFAMLETAHKGELPLDQQAFRQAVERLRRHEPVQYITGWTDFMGLRLEVSPAVLIPRPETEELVEWVVGGCMDFHASFSFPRMLDIGTGSGCIALALKKLLPLASVAGIDLSPEALAMAGANAKMLELAVSFRQVDIRDKDLWKDACMFDVIVSNPPYIPYSSAGDLDKGVCDHEPHLALFPEGDDPLVFYSTIAEFSMTHLRPGGHLYFEIYEASGPAILSLLAGFGFREVMLRKDLRGKDRMIRCIR